MNSSLLQARRFLQGIDSKDRSWLQLKWFVSFFAYCSPLVSSSVRLGDSSWTQVRNHMTPLRCCDLSFHSPGRPRTPRVSASPALPSLTWAADAAWHWTHAAQNSRDVRASFKAQS